MKTHKKKVLLTLSAFVLALAIIFAAFSVFALVYSRKNIDEDYDEMLFEAAKIESVTNYYESANPNFTGKDDYLPKLMSSLSLSGEKKLWYSLSEISPLVVDGFVATEDRGFYSHKGVDIRRTFLAALNSLFHFDSAFGASTITQQVIKNISGDNELSIRRKFTEIMRAMRLEEKHSKDEIMEVYLNIVPMGENLIGIGAASNAYFSKEASELSLSEAATLIGITNAPTRYNPHENGKACLGRRNDVLYAMYDFGIITEEAYKKAIDEPLNVQKRSSNGEQINSWLIETVNEDIIAAFRDKLGMSDNAARMLLYRGGLSVYTTANSKIQNMLELYFEDSSNFPNDIQQGLDYSFVICDSRNNNLLGIVGAVGKKSGNRLLNLALTPRAPGSALKPIALYAPLINQRKITYSTVFDDVPVVFNKNGSQIMEYPKNYPAVYDGLTTVKDALRVSKNTVAVRLYNMLGAENIYATLKNDYGFSTLVRHAYKDNGEIVTDLASSPLALGQLSYGVPLRKLTEAYTVFPSEGRLSNGRSFVAVYDSKGNLILDNARESKQILRPEAARIMNKLLMNVTSGGTASAVTLDSVVDTAGKTGTSGDDKDRLFIGYTPYFTAGIWCGYRDSSKSVGRVSRSHIKIWDEIMTELHYEILEDIPDEQIESFSQKGLIRAEYCMDSGELYTPDCALDPRGCRMEYGYFERGYAPKRICKRHVICYYDALTEGVATHKCPRENLEKIALLRIDDRIFEKDIVVTDAEYVYRDLSDGIKRGDSYDVPYFVNILGEGEYVGRGKRKKQFNSSCFLHDD